MLRLGALKYYLYRNVYTPLRARAIRNKKRIRVMFPVADLGAWKTEELYRLMDKHPKFDPILVFYKNLEEDDTDNLCRYADRRGYKYLLSDNDDIFLWNKFKSDIIFPQKPYRPHFSINTKSLYCYVAYGLHGNLETWSVRTDQMINTWQVYYENISLAEEYSRVLNRAKNGYATGLPIMDELSLSKDSVENPWKGSCGKKSIIYAPHHSINSENWWQSSTFLNMGEHILELAEKFSDRVQWAFKPHPLLRGKLEIIWGKEKADNYYARWSEVEWSQFESGKYLGLFKHSDAMIHDCGSFVEEYMFTGNPVMYLIRSDDAFEKFKHTVNNTYLKALELHQTASEIGQVERFIQSVIDGDDDGRKSKEHFVVENLTSPRGKTASENIIDCILNRDAFRAY